MKGWIIYKRNNSELTAADHGVNRLLEAAKTLNIDLAVYRPDQFDIKIHTVSDKQLFLNNRAVKSLPDFIIPRLGAETPYQALMLIRHLELLGVLSINTATSIDTVKDKLYVAQLLQHQGLPIPPTMLLKKPVPYELIEKEIGFPLVIKTLSGARGIGICLSENLASFSDLVDLLGLYHDDRKVLVQQFVANSRGRDLRVFVLNHEVIGCMLRTASNSFKANFSLGGKVEYYPINEEIKHLATACTRLLSLEIAGIDLLFGEKGLMICEANSSPGFKGMELATGADIALQIMGYISGKLPKK